MMLLVLACATPDDTAAPAAATDFVPSQGYWDVTVDATYGGDCALEDPSTGLGAEEWYVDPSVHGHLTIRPTRYQAHACVLDDHSFTCIVDWLGAAVSGSAVETSEHSIEGVFSDEHTLTGQYVVDASCEGGGCRALADTYGPDFRYPCTATADLSGVYRD